MHVRWSLKLLTKLVEAPLAPKARNEINSRRVGGGPVAGPPNTVEAAGIENERGRAGSTILRRGSTIRHGWDPGSVSSRASKCSNGGGVGTESSQAKKGGYELGDVVEPALARALVLAAEAQRWELVAQIATELQARRESRSSDPRSHGLPLGA
jgi:hypothetical protein